MPESGIFKAESAYGNNVWVAPESTFRDEKHEAYCYNDLCLPRPLIGPNLFRAELLKHTAENERCACMS
jgi:hypothetical protein